MKKIISFYIVLLIVLTGLLSYQGCSELQKNVVGPDYISAVHPSGWLDTTSSNFHGNAIRNANWSLNGCKLCHGIDYRGGNANASCYKCHANGPEACNTCHGDPADPNSPYPPKSLNGSYNISDPHVGAHFHHLNPDYAPTDQEKYRPVGCFECHSPVHNFGDTSHINPNRNSHAQIVFGPLALDSTGWGQQNPNPHFDTTTYLCSNVYCHGYFKNGNLNFQPQFNNPNSVKCGSCHGDSATGNPTPGAPNNVHYPHLPIYWTDSIKLCYHCHSTVDSLGNIVVPDQHINGVLDVNPYSEFRVKSNKSNQPFYLRNKKRQYK